MKNKFIVLASTNKHKIEEIKDLLDGYDVVGLDKVGFVGEIEETGETFFENALIKARAVHDFLSKKGICADVIADDSGLCVDALGGAPGVYSARYSGDHDFEANRKKLLKELDGKTNRKAHFACCIARITKTGEEQLFEGKVEGEITTEEIGSREFGYNCLFYSPELGKTFGEATMEERASVSHRARAVEKLKQQLKKENVVVQMAGIRNKEDALMCVECGVDIIGLLVGQKHTSDDFITKEMARDIKKALPKNVLTTLITHLENAKEIIDIAAFIGVDYIQLHSNIEEIEVEKIKKALPRVKLIRLIHIFAGKVLTDISKIKHGDFFITDSINEKTNQVGGTGLVHDFSIDKMLVEKLDKPVFVAGGLTPENVGKVVSLCKPNGVDVNSGCRAKDGSRDRQKVIDFVKNAKSVC